MRPFFCTTCEVGWVSIQRECDCEYCGRPGFTIYIDFLPSGGLTPSVCDLLYREAKKRTKEDADTDTDSPTRK